MQPGFACNLMTQFRWQAIDHLVGVTAKTMTLFPGRFKQNGWLVLKCLPQKVESDKRFLPNAA